MQTLYLRSPTRVRTFLIAGLTALVVLALLAPALALAAKSTERSHETSSWSNSPTLSSTPPSSRRHGALVVTWAAPSQRPAVLPDHSNIGLDRLVKCHRPTPDGDDPAATSDHRSQWPISPREVGARLESVFKSGDANDAALDFPEWHVLLGARPRRITSAEMRTWKVD